MRWFLALLISCAGLVTGCFRHSYRSHPYSLCQTDLRENVATAFASGTVSSGEWEGEAWWVFFEDPQLNRLIEVGLACHPDIRIADARIRLACEEAMVARSALFPHLFGFGDVKRDKISKLGPGFVPGFPDLFTDITLKLTSAVYELDVWQKNRSLYYGALDLVQAARAEYGEARLLLSTTIAAVYFDLQMNLERKKVTQERLEARQELLALHKQQFDLGIIPEFRLFEVDTDVQLLRDLIYAIEGEIEIDKHALAALAGNVSCLCGVSGRLEELPSARFDRSFPLPSTLPIDLLARRPDVNAQMWRVQAACLGVKVAQANFFPQIDLLGWIGFESFKADKLFRWETMLVLAEGSALLPLFTAGQLKAQLGEAREGVEIAIDGYNQTVLEAVQQVSDSLTELKTADERKKAVEQSFHDAESLYDLTRQKYERGIINKLTLLNAFENAWVQKDLEVQIQLTRFEAAVDLIRAIGGGYHAGCTPL